MNIDQENYSPEKTMRLVADINTTVDSKDIRSLLRVNSALSTALKHWSDKTTVQARIDQAARREQDASALITSMNGETITLAGCIIQKAEWYRSRSGQTCMILNLTDIISDPNMKTLQAVDSFMLGVRREPLYAYLRAAGFAVALNALHRRRVTTTIGVIAWDHGIEELYRISNFGMQYMPPTGTATSTIWSNPTPTHGDYKNFPNRRARMLGQSVWLEVLDSTVMNPVPEYDPNRVPQSLVNNTQLARVRRRHLQP